MPVNLNMDDVLMLPVIDSGAEPASCNCDCDCGPDCPPDCC
jgi:hypothetical protein